MLGNRARRLDYKIMR
ncbi:hypothetical protein K7Q41_RS06575 [Escherichia coli]